uniref:Zinc finger, CCHC-type n=1 Tax=Tanacetum cinerariifolium TaxID=118510 RepID=A0A6L2M556_TANCI|nr:hypothetical protein [Tanacetum cinerariifolium]
MMDESASATLLALKTRCLGITKCEEMFRKAENKDPLKILAEVKALKGRSISFSFILVMGEKKAELTLFLTTSDPRHKMRPNMFIDITIRVSNASSLKNLIVAFDAINDRRLPLAPLVYTLVRPSMTTSSTNNSVFRSFFEKQKLTRPKFIDWYRQLRIVLSIEDKLPYLEQPIPPVPEAPDGQQVAPEILAAHTAWVKGSKEIAGLMLMTMEPEIQQNLEPLHAHEMLKELKTQFAQQAEQELLQTTRDFHSCRQEEGHMGKTVNELHSMLKLHEQTLSLPKSNAPALHVIQAGKKSHSQKGAKGKNQGKGKFAPKPKIPSPPKRENPAKDSICHECREIGYWKRNCPQYLAKLMKKKKNTASGVGGSGSKG